MSVDWQTAAIAFNQGLDTRTQSKLVVPGKWLTLINYSLSRTGTPQRRCGVVSYVPTANGNGLALHDDELLTINAGAVSTVGAGGGGVAPLTKRVPGELPYLEVGTKREVIFNNGFHDSCDTAFGDGFQCAVFREYSAGGVVTGLGVTLTDTASGAKLLNNSSLVTGASAVCPRVVFFDSAFFIFYISGTSLFCHIVETSAPSTLGAATAVYLDANLSSKNFDACTFTDAACVNVTFLSGLGGGVNSIRCIGVTRTGSTPAASLGPLTIVTVANATEASIQSLTCIDLAGASTNQVAHFFVKTAGGALAAQLYGVTTNAAYAAIVTGPTALDVTSVPAVATACHITATLTSQNNIQIFTDQQSSYLVAGGDIRPLRVGVVSTAMAGVLAFGNLMRSACFDVNGARASGPQGPFIAGKAFASGASTFLPVCILENYNANTLTGLGGSNCASKSAQCAAYIIDTTDWSTSSSTGTSAVVAGMLYQSLGLVDPTLGGAAPTVTALCSTPTSGSYFMIALQERGKLDLMKGFNATPVGVSTFRLTLRTTLKPISAQLGESTFFAGGVTAAYDGKQISGFVFPNYPEGISCVVAAPGGGAKLTIGVHQIVAVYEWIDGAGNRHQSAPSLPVSVTVVNASDRIDVIIPTTQLSQASGYTGISGNLDTLRIVLYMTETAGLTFYRTISDFASATVNTPATSTVSMSIGNPQTMLDAALVSNEQLYTQPAIAGTTLANIAPPPSTCLGVIHNRLFYDKADRPGWGGFSQQPIVNVGLQFADSLEFFVPTNAGKATGYAEMDEKAVIFTHDRIFVMYGTGPKPDGSYSGYSLPQDTSSDVGCIEPRSILEVPDGLMFQSAKGIYLLTRDLQTRFIGAGVQQYTNPVPLDSPPSQIYAAAMLADRAEARFVLRLNSVQPFLLLVYSFLNDAWSTHFGVNSVTSSNNYWMADTVWWPAAVTPTGHGAMVHISTNQGLAYDNEEQVHDQYGVQAVTPFYTLATTSWLKLSALEGFQRVRWLYLTGSADSAPTSLLNIAVDYDDGGASDKYNFNTDLSTAMAAAPNFALDLRTKLRRMKCKSVQFTFWDIPADSSKQPLQGIEALTLELGIKKGVRRLPAAQSVG